MLGTLKFPLEISPQGSLSVVSGRERVLRGLTLFFATPLGARPMVPEFGCPPVPSGPAFVPGWVADVEHSLLALIWGAQACRVLAGLDTQGTLRVQVYLRTDGGEEVNYDVTFS